MAGHIGYDRYGRVGLSRDRDEPRVDVAIGLRPRGRMAGWRQRAEAPSSATAPVRVRNSPAAPRGGEERSQGRLHAGRPRA